MERLMYVNQGSKFDILVKKCEKSVYEEPGKNKKSDTRAIIAEFVALAEQQ